ncbi:MAG: hypothetical protein ACM3H8_04345 [Sphingobacteriales bacterium]
MWILTGLSSFCIITGNAQNPVKKVYAYSREIIPGIIKVKMKPGREPIREIPVVKTAWYFFLQGNIDTTKLKVRAIWINKKKYTVAKQEFVITPFTVFLNNNKPFELVPATKDQVLQVFPGQQLAEHKNNDRALKRLLSSDELVIELISKKKLYYSSLKKRTVLSPLEGL